MHQLLFHRLSLIGSELDFHVDKKSAFQLPLGNVSHATTAKNEVILEFHQNDDAEVSLMEMRFYVPSTDATTDAAGVRFLHSMLSVKWSVSQRLRSTLSWT